MMVSIHWGLVMMVALSLLDWHPCRWMDIVAVEALVIGSHQTRLSCGLSRVTRLGPPSARSLPFRFRNGTGCSHDLWSIVDANMSRTVYLHPLSFAKKNHSHTEKESSTPTLKQQSWQILQAALLIAGTTIGGGFLALPSLVQPFGFYPSAACLLAVWSFFLLQSHVVVECLSRTRTLSSNSTPGLSTAARTAMGVKGEFLIGSLLVLVTEATLVSQLSRAGSLLPLLTRANSYVASCALAALSTGVLVFGPSPSHALAFASRANGVLTAGFLLSAASLACVGAPLAQWDRLGAAAAAGTSNLYSAIPTYLQLLVYGEILPTVCQLLQYRKTPIRMAIGMGSGLALALVLGWSALGIALAPSGTNMDPVDALFSLGGGLFRTSLTSLAITAILTTILGSYLALRSALFDASSRSRFSFSKNRIGVGAMIVLPPLAIASISPTLFLKSMDFAGSYPVLLLWGVFPPLLALRLRRLDLQQQKKKRGEDVSVEKGQTIVEQHSFGSGVGLVGLAVLSILMVSASAVPDFLGLVKVLKSMVLDRFLPLK